MKRLGNLISRRRFLRGSAVIALGGTFFPHSARAGQGPNSKLSHACIGVGGMGWSDLQNFLQHPRVQIVALCDVDANNLNRAAAAAPGARLYRDWRELLAKEGSRIDSVNVAVPDHMHYAIEFSAIRLGKHVYGQKPMCHDVAEIRSLARETAKKRVITQLGTQVASSVGERTAVMWLRAGVIGPVQRAYLCSNRPGAIEAYRLKGPRPPAGQAPPASLSWDLWLGTAPERPYAPDIYHPTKWRAWQDFGTGWSGDIGCHIFDALWKGLGMKPATSVVAEVQTSWEQSPERRADTWPQGDHITWTFPGNELTETKELPVEWFDGEFYPPKDIRARYSVEDYPPESAMVVGRDGALLYPHGGTPVLLPEDKFRSYARPKLPNRNHYHHWVDACLGGEMCESHFVQTGPMTEAIILGTVAIRVPGQKLEWDSAKMRIPNHRQAERYLRRTYRTGWHVPLV